MTDAPLIQGELLPSRFNQLLSGPLSTRIAYLRSLLCPCRGTSGGGPDPACPACSGLGYLWSDVVGQITRTKTLTRAPVLGYENQERLSAGITISSIEDEHGQTYPPQALTVRPDGSVLWDDAQKPADFTLYTVTYASGELRAGVQGVMNRREFQVRGEFDVLDLEMTLDRHMADGTTLNPAWDCGESDRFILLDQWRRQAQKVQNHPKGNRTLYRHMRNLTVASLSGGSIVYWEAGKDYQFADGLVTWQAGRGPKLGDYYTVQGEANPEYYVFMSLPQTRQADGHPLPRRIVLKGFERFANRKPAQAVGGKE